MSSKHARIEPSFGRWVLTDTESKNGSIVDGHTTKRAVLTDGSLIELGHTLFIFFERLPVDAEAPSLIELTPSDGPPGFATLMPVWNTELTRLRQIASSEIPMLIEGESGTGKEVIARAIHDQSNRHGAFVPVNCGALPENLVESELFGYKKGAFSGAQTDHPGLVRTADAGTLFLDEIGDLPLSLQAKILRALEEKQFERVGGTAPLKVDVRVVAATNRNLKAAVAARQYREDLYFRLSVFPIVIPPLRDRPKDIPTLARYFIDKFCRDLNKPPLALSPAAEDELRTYGWPGNVRELQNCIERAAILTEGDTIHPRHLSLSFRGPTLAAPIEGEDGPWSKIDLSGTLADASKRTLLEVERRKIVQALKEAGGNLGAAAEILQVSYKALAAKVKDHGLE